MQLIFRFTRLLLMVFLVTKLFPLAEEQQTVKHAKYVHGQLGVQSTNYI